jgi:hypothetical protein
MTSAKLTESAAHNKSFLSTVFYVDMQAAPTFQPRRHGDGRRRRGLKLYLLRHIGEEILRAEGDSFSHDSKNVQRTSFNSPNCGRWAKGARRAKVCCASGRLVYC